MVDERKIACMSRLAVYDKTAGVKDRKINEYFRHDYIYKKNVGARLGAVLGTVILLGFYWADRFLAGGLDILTLDLRKAGVDALLVIVAAAVFYTLIGTIISAREYAKVMQRLHEYVYMSRRLERIREASAENTGEDAEEYYEADSDGADLSRTRRNNPVR